MPTRRSPRRASSGRIAARSARGATDRLLMQVMLLLRTAVLVVARAARPPGSRARAPSAPAVICMCAARQLAFLRRLPEPGHRKIGAAMIVGHGRGKLHRLPRLRGSPPCGDRTRMWQRTFSERAGRCRLVCRAASERARCTFQAGSKLGCGTHQSFFSAVRSSVL
jgi:hypothetical protein